MLAWLDEAISCLEQQTDLVLITVVEVRGSAPRNAATKMLVANGQQWLTIGGGNLEWQATARAKEYLRQIAGTGRPAGISVDSDSGGGLSYRKENIWFDIFQLGPSLGQCCGGVVGVLFEHLDQSDLPWLNFLQITIRNGQTVRKHLQSPAGLKSADQSLDKEAVTYQVYLQSVTDTELKAVSADFHNSLTSAQKASGPRELCIFKRQADGGFGCTEYLQPESMNIYVFGAGHVGKALINVLASLPCQVIWVDSRAEQFPTQVASNVTIEETDIPEAVVDAALPGSCFVIMTHDHALDQRLCEQIMKRDDACYFGLIGSRTKRQKFEHRFKAKGIDPARYEKMVCPIGIPELKGKQPAIIALAVAAQLMCIRERGHIYAQKPVAESIR